MNFLREKTKHSTQHSENSSRSRIQSKKMSAESRQVSNPGMRLHQVARPIEYNSRQSSRKIDRLGMFSSMSMQTLIVNNFTIMIKNIIITFLWLSVFALLKGKKDNQNHDVIAEKIPPSWTSKESLQVENNLPEWAVHIFDGWYYIDDNYSKSKKVFDNTWSIRYWSLKSIEVLDEKLWFWIWGYSDAEFYLYEKKNNISGFWSKQDAIDYYKKMKQ